jgi:ABC-type branched-subunit amino acid transport system substrate-binding protein
MSGTKPFYKIDFKEVLTRFIKYALEGIVVAIAAYSLPSQSIPASDVAQIAAIAMATFVILDFFAPTMSKAARMGAGAGIGANLVGFPGNKITL